MFCRRSRSTRALSTSSSTTSTRPWSGRRGRRWPEPFTRASTFSPLTNSGSDRALVVMSDGEAFEPLEDVQTEARRAAQQGISLVTVGFGTTRRHDDPDQESRRVDHHEEGRKRQHGDHELPPRILERRGRRRRRDVHPRGRDGQGCAHQIGARHASHESAGQPRWRDEDAALPVVPLSRVAALCCSTRCSSSAAVTARLVPPHRRPPPRDCC